jgi:hypothetical protein
MYINQLDVQMMMAKMGKFFSYIWAISPTKDIDWISVAYFLV